MSVNILIQKNESPARATVVVSGLPTTGASVVRLYTQTELEKTFVTETVSAGTGGAGLIDYYPPLGIDFTYIVEDGNGVELGRGDTRFDAGVGWLRSSTDPSVGIPVSVKRRPGCATILFQSFTDYGSATKGTLAMPLGAARPLWLTSGVNEPVKTGFSLLVEGSEMVKQTHRFLTNASMLCLQSLPEWGLNSPVVHFPAKHDVTVIKPARLAAGAVFKGEIYPVKPPAKLFIVELTVGYVDTTAEGLKITVGQVETNAKPYSIAEIEANPDVLFEGSSA